MKKTLALVGCGSEKRDQSAEAQSLYTSAYFSKKRQWAEGCHTWRILSAKHGLVHPTTVLEPYDTAIADLTEPDVHDWAQNVINDLRPHLSDFEEIVVLAGRDYYHPISDDLEHAPPTVHWPFQGKRLFEQMAWLDQHYPPDQTTIESFE